MNLKKVVEYAPEFDPLGLRGSFVIFIIQKLIDSLKATRHSLMYSLYL